MTLFSKGKDVSVDEVDDMNNDTPGTGKRRRRRSQAVMMMMMMMMIALKQRPTPHA